MNKNGTILMENLIFIILNIVFFAIIALFLFSKAGAVAVVEEKYAKQIALLIDASEPGAKITLNMEDAIAKAEKENWPIDKVITFQDNVVTVRLREKGGYSYSFFNDVSVSPAVFDITNRQEYYFILEKK